jgi:hypothetical protein
VFAFLESPRRRRRLLWLGICVVGVAAVTTTILLLPERSSRPESFSDEPAQVVEQRQPRLSVVDRTSIERTVDRFVIAALDRSNPALAWKLAGPDLRGSTTARDWVEGRMPIPPFRARGRHFHGWTNIVVARNSVLFDVLLQPRAGVKSGAIAYNAQVIRRGGGWAVNRWYPVATFAAVGETPRVVGPNDYAAAGGAENSETSGQLGGEWIALPFGLLALGVVVVALLFGRNWFRFRRARKAFAATGSREMPKLPGQSGGPST